jgi:glutathione-independent formaldehyde dehydrogenase
VGLGVEFIKAGDICFNIACGRCRNCKERKTGICLNVNPDRPGSAYGYVDIGGWVGGGRPGQLVLVPYADWNLLKFPDKDQALEKIPDLAILSDTFPTGFHGAVTAGVGVGHGVVCGRYGLLGLAAATSAQLLGAAVVIVGDLNTERLAQARSFGCETVDLREGGPAEQIEQILGVDSRSSASGTTRRGMSSGAACSRSGFRMVDVGVRAPRLGYSVRRRSNLRCSAHHVPRARSAGTPAPSCSRDRP